jgi:LEA14-like dessication related protein
MTAPEAMMKRFPGSAGNALLAVVLLALAGCGPTVRQPEVTLQNVRIGGIGLTGGTLLIDVQVYNPNRFGATADRLTYEVLVADPRQPGDTTWLEFAAGVYAEPVRLGARDSVTVRVPVEFTLAQVGGAAGRLLRAGNVEYLARGTVDVRTSFGGRTVPFRRRGMISLLGR